MPAGDAQVRRGSRSGQPPSARPRVSKLSDLSAQSSPMRRGLTTSSGPNISCTSSAVCLLRARRLNHMIAKDSHGLGDSRPRFSSGVAEQLAKAMREFDDHLPASGADLRAALAAPALEARARDFGPEQLVIALKAVLADVGDVETRSAQAREKFQSLVLKGMLTAYFGPGGTKAG